jgi:hypothetical protein
MRFVFGVLGWFFGDGWVDGGTGGWEKKILYHGVLFCYLICFRALIR